MLDIFSQDIPCIHLEVVYFSFLLYFSSMQSSQYYFISRFILISKKIDSTCRIFEARDIYLCSFFHYVRATTKYRIIMNFLTIRYLMMRLRLHTVLLSRSITYIFPFFSIANIIMPVTQWNLTIYRVLVSPFSLFRFVSAILHPCLC